MESNNNHVIMVNIDWHRVSCIVYFVTANHMLFDENYPQRKHENTACESFWLRWLSV